MKIAIYGSGVPTSVGRPPAHLLDLVRAGEELAVVPLRGGAFPYGPADHLFVQLAHVDAAVRAAADGADAICIDTFGEYGLDAARAAVDVPVVGAAEAAFAAANVVGRRFEIVTVWPESFAWLYAERLRRHQAESRCTGVTYVGSKSGGSAIERVDAVRTDLQLDRPGLLARTLECCRAAVARGADTIVLGCTCMGPMYAALAAGLDVPVVCASRAAYTASVAAARLAVRPSRRAYPAPHAEFHARIAAQFANEPVVEEACPVCVVAADN